MYIRVEKWQNVFQQKPIKNKIRKILLFAVIPYFAFLLMGSKVSEAPVIKVEPIKQVKKEIVIPETTEQTIRREFKDTPILISIAKCESHFTQFESDGSVHRGKVNPQDVGVMQINEHYHLAASKAMGIDIYTLAGNIAYAKILYKQSGTTPWNWSKYCWAPDRG